MKIKTRIWASFMASIFMLSSVSGNVSATSHDHHLDHAVTTVDTPLIWISTKDASDLIDLNSGAYLDAYKVNVISYKTDRGDETNRLQSAFDNNWETAWYATDNKQVSSITVTFDKISEISRILYGVNSKAYDPDGYPTKLAIAVSETDEGDDFVEVAATTSKASLNKVLFTLTEPKKAKRIKFIFKEAYKGFASAAELMFLKSDPVFDTVLDLFKDEKSRQLKEEYQNDEIFDTLEAQAEKHMAKNYLIDKIRFARKVFTGEITAANSLDFPVEVIQKTGPDSEKYVVLFVPDGFSLYEQDEFIKTLKKSVKAMMETEPFREYADEFNMYALRVPSNVSGVGYNPADTYFRSFVDARMPQMWGIGRAKELLNQFERNYLENGGKVLQLNIMLNSTRSGGVATNIGNLPLSMQTANISLNVMTHELGGHGIGDVHDEYVNSLTNGPNLTTNTEESPWKEFLGFRDIKHAYLHTSKEGSHVYKPSHSCIMHAGTEDFCEVCRLAIATSINNVIKNKKELYIAEPIFTIETSDYPDNSYAYSMDKDGQSRKEINDHNITEANGKKIEFRTVIKNFTETSKILALQFEIIDSNGNEKQEASQDFTLAASELKSLSIESVAFNNLTAGDKIKGRVIDKATNAVLADADTFNKKLGNINIKYKVGDANIKTDISLPNVAERTLKIQDGSEYRLNPVEISGYTYTGSNISETSVVAQADKDVEIIYYYTKNRGKVTLNLVDDNNTVTKSVYRYIGHNQSFTPSQSDFPAKEGYKLVLPKSVTFDGVNDLNLTYAYTEGEPEPTPVDPPKEEISQGGSTTPITSTLVVPVTPTSVTPAPVVPVTPTPVTLGDNVKQEDDIPVVDKETQKNEEDKTSKVFSFTDVDAVEGNWKYESVKYIYENNIMNGISDTNQFEPDSSLTRSMFATVLYRMAGNPTIAYTDTFSDVVAEKWYSDAILWANQEGIVSGLADGQYGIDVNITREQIAKMLYEYAKRSGYDVSGEATLEDFTDKDSVSGWATDYMKWATSAGMISGKPNGDGSYRLDPKGEATRAECAAMLTRFIKKYQ